MVPVFAIGAFANMAVLSTVKLGAVAVCANFIGASAYDTSVQSTLTLSHGMEFQV